MAQLRKRAWEWVLTMPFLVFEYMYRDAANYKVHGSLWLRDDVRSSDLNDFSRYLEQSEHFIAEQVGVPPLQFDHARLGELGSDDHAWHSFVGFRRVNELPPGIVAHGSCCALLQRFAAIKGQWRVESSEVYQNLW